jgi:hypothetical protein
MGRSRFPFPLTLDTRGNGNRNPCSTTRRGERCRHAPPRPGGRRPPPLRRTRPTRLGFEPATALRLPLRADSLRRVLPRPHPCPGRTHSCSAERYNRWHHQEVDRNCAREMVANEGFPGLRRRTSRPLRRLRHVLGDRVLVDAMTKLREFVGDPPTAPEGVLARHPLDEAHDLWLEWGPTNPPRLPRPEPCEAAPMPRDHGRRANDRQGIYPPRPHAGDDDPERTVDGPKPRPRPRSCPTQNRKLLAEQEVLGDQARPRPQGCEQCANDGLQDREHPGELGAGRRPCHRRIAAADAVCWPSSLCLENEFFIITGS